MFGEFTCVASNADFSDCLIVAVNKYYKVRRTVTFDVNDSKLDGFEFLQ